MGFKFMALLAGSRPAIVPVRSRVSEALVSVRGSAKESAKSMCAIIREAASAHGRPMAMPMRVRRMLSLSMRPRMPLRCEPMAMRMPISRVRRLTA